LRPAGVVNVGPKGPGEAQVSTPGPVKVQLLAFSVLAGVSPPLLLAKKLLVALLTGSM
jgi:hypothetical protein